MTIASADAVCPVGIYKIDKFRVEPKDKSDACSSHVIEVPTEYNMSTAAPAVGPVGEASLLDVTVDTTRSQAALHVTCAARVATAALTADNAASLTCTALDTILARIMEGVLAPEHLTWQNCAFVFLYLRYVLPYVFDFPSGSDIARQ